MMDERVSIRRARRLERCEVSEFELGTGADDPRWELLVKHSKGYESAGDIEIERDIPYDRRGKSKS